MKRTNRINTVKTLVRTATMVSLAVTAATVSVEAQAVTRYSIQKVNTPGLAGLEFTGNAINSGGDVVGQYLKYLTSGSWGGYKNHGFGVINNVVVDMPNIYFCSVTPSRPDACNTMAHGINDNDVAVGETWDSGAYWGQAFIRRYGILESLMPGFNWSYARDINNGGFIVGNYRPPIYANRAFVHHQSNAGNSSAVKDLTTLAGSAGNFDSIAYGINTNNVIVGSSEVSDNVWRATMWTFSNLQAGAPLIVQGMTLTNLGVLSGGTHSYALDVNDNKLVVGYANMASGYQHAFRWQNGVMTDLGDLCPTAECPAQAYAVNNSGIIVGTAGTMTSFARGFVVQSNAMYDVNTLVDDPGNVLNGDVIRYAYDVNGVGKIVATGNYGVYVLTPK